MTAAWALARIVGWFAVGFVLVALIPVSIALLVVGYAFVHASRAHRDALLWVLSRIERIAQDADGRSQ